MRWLSQYAGWHHGAVASPISFTESDADAESDVASATASLKAIFVSSVCPLIARTFYGLLVGWRVAYRWVTVGDFG
jgi:hypothetical protein